MKAQASLAAETKNKLLPLVGEQTAKLEKAYENGQADLLTVLRAREQRLQLEATVLDATCDWNLARIRHETATRAAPAPQIHTTGITPPVKTKSTTTRAPLRSSK